MSLTRKLSRVLCLLVVAGFSLPAMAEISARLDRVSVGPGETVQLLLQHEGRTSKDPDLSPLQQDFEVLGTSRGSSMQFSNGDFSAQVQLRITLSPRRSGKLVVPPLEWDGERTQALTLNVGSGSSGNAAASGAQTAPVFVTATVDKTQPYVQSAVVLTVQVHTDQPLYQASLDLPRSDDLLVQTLGEDQQSRETRDGREYQVITRRYLIFPQRSGTLELDGVVLDAQISDRSRGSAFDSLFGNSPLSGMMGASRPIRSRSEPITLDVRPRPAAAAGGTWLPARNLSLDEEWRPDGARVHVGEPITRHMRLSAEGLIAEQLPDLAQLMTLPDGLKAYPDQAQTGNDLQGGTLVGRREQDVAIIASRPGRYTLPELRLKWWDITRDELREVVLPERTLDILPAVGEIPGAPEASAPLPQQATGNADEAAPRQSHSDAVLSTPSPAASGLWFWLSLLFAALWLLTLGAWYLRSRARRSAPSPVLSESASRPNASAARKAFREACRANDAPAARRHLLVWARAHWPQDPPAGLNALALRLDDPQQKQLLQALDRAVYAGASWQGAALDRALKALPDESPSAAGVSTAQLAGLYP